ncbi:MAG: hypothetical protein PVG74_03475 [Desulfobacterales bacterium]|jgi:hypothetical protein
MKQIELDELVEQLFGARTGASGWRRGIEEKAPELVAKVAALLPLLEQVTSKTECSTRQWPGIWIAVERETVAEVERRYSEDDPDELNDYLAMEYPHATKWLRAGCYIDNDEFGIFLYPDSIQFAVRPDTDVILLPFPAAKHRVELQAFIDWLIPEIEQRLHAFFRDPDGFRSELERTLPERERLGRVQRCVYWEYASTTKRLIKDELTKAEIDTFIAIASELREAPALRNMTLRDFLNACAVAYEGAGYDLKTLDVVAQYRRMADGRDEGLLSIDLDSPSALRHWFESRPQGGHPWEIVRGGNTTHISLYLVPTEDERFRLQLAGTATTRGAEVAKMVLALHHAKVSFELADVDFHVLRAKGSDWIGIVPSACGVGGTGAADLFPENWGVHDTTDHSLLDEYPELRTHTEWLPLEHLKRRANFQQPRASSDI